MIFIFIIVRYIYTYIYIYIYIWKVCLFGNILSFEIITVGSQIVAHTLIETGNGPNKPNTINL